uniref:Metalloendopeptidase n=1 Tax=Globodera pallida TaxID=36090 RepID=A0A183C6N7_GLOPA
MIVLKLGLLLIALKACVVYGDEPSDKIWSMCENELFSLDNCQSRLICYQSKLAKDSGNWKAGNRFRVNSPNGNIAYECAGNDGSKGWHAVRVRNEGIGMVTLDASFGSKSLTNVSKHPEIKELTSGGQSAGEEFMNALSFGAFMIDFDDMPLQIAALEIRQSIGKKDTKLCKTKLSPVMPKAQHVDHFGTNWMQIEFPMDVPNFSLNISMSPYWIACAAHQRNDKADHIQENYTKVSEVANQDQFNACSKVPTSSVCNKSSEFYACYKSIKNQTHMNKEIAEICQKRLSQAPISTSREFRFKSGEVSKLMRYVPFSFTEFGHQSSEIHAESIKETEDLKPFTRPPWDNMSFPSTKMSSNDKRTKDPLEADDVIYTKDQAQGQHDYFVEMCAKCRNSSLGKKPRRQKRQHMRNVKIWTKFPIPIKFDTVSLGDKISFAIATIRRGVAWISEKTCVDFTFDETNDPKGIQIVDNGKRDRCGDSFMGQFMGWQELSLNCEQMYNGAHELLHALGLQHEHQRRDAYSYIKLNPFDKENAQWTANYGFPYDYGSIMHYPPIMSDHNSYDKITLNRFYQQTIGQTEKPSFKDLAIINYMYCRYKCDEENLCQNGGYPNPRLCTECFCPEGYGGNHCEELQENVECKYKMDGIRELEADLQSRTLDTEIFCWSKKCICMWRITPKDGKKLRIQLKRLEIESQCSHMPCQKSYVEINFQKDKRARGARLCCPEAISQVSPSQNWIEAEEAGTDIIISVASEIFERPWLDKTGYYPGLPDSSKTPGYPPGYRVDVVQDPDNFTQKILKTLG